MALCDDCNSLCDWPCRSALEKFVRKVSEFRFAGVHGEADKAIVMLRREAVSLVKAFSRKS